ncbi:unnamed protein product [Trichobilharzia regenti]|nr:unnamed protein product [Trichobilharzia regenti]
MATQFKNYPLIEMSFMMNTAHRLVIERSILSATNSADSSKQMLPGEVMHSSNDVNYEFPVYTELVWNHFLEALNTGHDMIAEELMIRFPIPVNYINSCCVTPFDHFNSNVNVVENTLAPSQILSPNHIIQKLLSSHPNLAITYLKHLCCCLPNCVSLVCLLKLHKTYLKWHCKFSIVELLCKVHLLISDWLKAIINRLYASILTSYTRNPQEIDICKKDSNSLHFMRLLTGAMFILQ